MHNPLTLSPPCDDELFERLALDLEQHGFSVQPDALPANVTASLTTQVDELTPRQFRPAVIGRGERASRNRFVRRNRIHWLEEDQVALGAWHEWTASLQAYLNRRLFLGLFSFESHLTLYQRGDFYKRHVDAFKGERNRVVSLVAYLNEGWLPDQGGELVLYPEGQAPIQVTPSFGTVVIFLSEDVPHEVRVVERTRYGVAGWFRLNATTSHRVDPPR